MAVTGVNPVFKYQFKIGTKGLASSPEDMKPIADLEGFTPNFDNVIQEYFSMDQEGWKKVLPTGKGLSISLSGKRHIGDEGNDYVASLAWKSGTDCMTKFEMVDIAGNTYKFNCAVNVTTLGGEATDIDALEFEVIADGKPTIEPAQVAAVSGKK